MRRSGWRISRKKINAEAKRYRRAPKTPEQRRKIADAIAAKWLDKEYRERVCSGIASYHGTSMGTRAPRKPRPAGEPGVKRQTVKKKTMQTGDDGLEEAQGKAVPVKRKKSATPYKDPMAGEKLEMITKIRAQRAALEIEKKKAIRRARSLIVEAERAANALETAAATSPFAQASLIEARKLVTEARASLEYVDDEGHVESAPDETSENPATLDLDSNDLDNQNQSNMMKQENKHVNGLKLPTSNVNGIGFHFDGSTPSETEKLYHRIEKSMERAFLLPSASSTLKDVNGDFGLIDFQVSQSMVDETERHNCNAIESTEDFILGALEEEASTSAENAEMKENCTPGTLDEDKGKMRWVRGRLVKVDNEAERSEA
ncbi:hypothetical protein EJB05_22948 [Eragrostis curvula]|uniref:Nuclease associated modular domain-containing protein n=1 Tax=Eragrostis curvula TaxID=38414 RepID=A0A5J9V782_9POAL|nr:hypothetical protein EJB05_22948 [Eragrostis curvula]